MDSISLQQVQSVELEILSTVLTILDRYNIKAFLAGGTLIGYVRHNGFIPWDDDIDIMLMREDYERAKTILKNELPKEYIYCDYKDEYEYPYNFAKVRKVNSAFVHGGDSHLKINQGIYIDIFPLDYALDDEAEQKKACSQIRNRRLLVDISFMDYYKHGKLRKFWMLPVIFLTRLLVNPKKQQEKIDHLISQWSNRSNRNKIVSYCSAYKNEVHDADILGQGKPVSFCGVKALIPEKYDEYLKNLYGDYMQLPPIEKRVSHHDVVHLSLTEPYKTL